MAVGGNENDPKCGNSSDPYLHADDIEFFMANYTKLKNCSDTIQEACLITNSTYNANDTAEIMQCTELMDTFVAGNKECIVLRGSNNGTAQCQCWAKMANDVNFIKNEKCSARALQNAIKAQKNICIKEFSACKKTEDRAVKLISHCMNDHSMSLINQTGESLHLGALKDTVKELFEIDKTFDVEEYEDFVP